MGERLVFVLPLPPQEASLNFRPASRGGRLAQNVTIQAYKAGVAAIMKSNKPKDGWPSEPLVIDYVWFLGRKKLTDKRTLRDGLCRPKDDDNAKGAAKPVQDAMQLAGILPKGDAAKRVRVGDVALLTRQKDHGGVMQLIVIVSTDSEAKGANDAKAGGL